MRLGAPGRICGSTQVKDFVVKTAVKTFLIILAIVVVAFGVFNFACPQHMATFSEQIGNYTMAVRYAALRYSYSGSTYDLARCVEDSILAADGSPRSDANALIVEYGNQFFEKDDCEKVLRDLTEERGIDYTALFGNNLVNARYYTGDFAGALSLAVELNGSTSFVYGNALMSLTAKVVGAQDAANAPALLEALNGITPSDGGEQSVLDSIKDSVRALISPQ